MLNGIGGSADFLRNAKLSVMHTPSSCVSLSPLRYFSFGISAPDPFSLLQSTKQDRPDWYLVHRSVRNSR